MAIAIRTVLSLIALLALYDMGRWCKINFFGPDYWRWDCVTRFALVAVGVPLVFGLIVGYLKKSRFVFWNTFVGVLFIEGMVLVFEEWFL